MFIFYDYLRHHHELNYNLLASIMIAKCARRGELLIIILDTHTQARDKLGRADEAGSLSITSQLIIFKFFLLFYNQFYRRDFIFNNNF